MCTRYYIDDKDPELIPVIKEMKEAQLYRTFLKKQASPIISSGEIFPTNIVPVIAPDRTRSSYCRLRWAVSLLKRQNRLI